jgi:ankyrin repeat protein
LIGLKEDVRIIDVVNKEGFTLLHLACYHSNQQSVEVLLNKVRVDSRVQEAAQWINA